MLAGGLGGGGDLAGVAVALEGDGDDFGDFGFVLLVRVVGLGGWGMVWTGGIQAKTFAGFLRQPEI